MHKKTLKINPEKASRKTNFQKSLGIEILPKKIKEPRRGFEKNSNY